MRPQHLAYQEIIVANVSAQYTKIPLDSTPAFGSRRSLDVHWTPANHTQPENQFVILTDVSAMAMTTMARHATTDARNAPSGS